MDREERSDAVEESVFPGQCLQVQREEAGLPVIAVDDVRAPADCFQPCQDGAAEERESLGVVVVVRAIAVQVVATEQVVLRRQIDRYPVVEQGAVQRPWPVERLLARCEVGETLVSQLPGEEPLVQGGGDRHVISGVGKRFGERTRHVGEPAGA